MAIMSYADGPTKRVPVGVSSWKEIRQAGDDLINTCICMCQEAGGTAVVPSCMSLFPPIANRQIRSAQY